MNAVVHDLERSVEARGHRSRIRVRDHESFPLRGRERLEDRVELLRVLLESSQGLLPRELAEVLCVVVERRGHHLKACRVGGAALLGLVPVLHVTLEDVDHVPHEVARLPLGTARLNVPVLRV